MSARFWFAPLTLAIVGLASITPLREQQPVVAAAPANPQEPTTTTLDDQVELAVTVYNSDIALVRSTRARRSKTWCRSTIS